MAILIKDMKMPKCCAECMLLQCDEDTWYEEYEPEEGEARDLRCILQSTELIPEDEAGAKRQDFCPLTEIIYCKDCSKWCICHHSDDYFCADGERREDGENNS